MEDFRRSEDASVKKRMPTSDKKLSTEITADGVDDVGTSSTAFTGVRMNAGGLDPRIPPPC
jgi:hypothetical protein